MGLIAVGAGLRLVISGHQMGALVYLTAVKLLAVPAIAWWVGDLFDLQAEYLAAAVVMAALPTASTGLHSNGTHGRRRPLWWRQSSR
jgi:malonate transporter and related proteins